MDSCFRSMYQSKTFPFRVRTNYFTNKSPLVPAVSHVSMKWAMCCLGLPFPSNCWNLGGWYPFNILKFWKQFHMFQWRESLSRSTILSFYGVCNHLLQLLNTQRCNWGWILWLIFLHNCLPFVTIFDSVCMTWLSNITMFDVILEKCNLVILFFNDLYEHVDLFFKFNHSVFTCIHASHHNRHDIWTRHLLIWPFIGGNLLVNHVIFFDYNSTFWWLWQLFPNVLCNLKWWHFLRWLGSKLNSGYSSCQFK